MTVPGGLRSVAARFAEACGVLAPAAFIGGWIAAGERTPGYSALHGHISDLARTDAPERLRWCWPTSCTCRPCDGASGSPA